MCAALALAVTACGGGGSSAPGGQAAIAQGGWQAIVDAAKKEGQVVFDSSDDAKINAAVIKAFNEQYPDIQVKLIDAGPEIAARVAAAEQAGIHNEDVIATGFQNLVETKDWFMSLNPTNLPVLGEQKWEEGMTADTWVSKYNQYLGVAWNTNIIKNGDSLKTWQDLINPEFKGKIAVADPRATATNMSWLDAVDKVLGDDYVTKLLEGDPHVDPAGSVSATQAVAAGQYGIIYPATSQTVASLRAKGAPIAFSVLSQPLVNVPGHLAVYKNAPHPNAALVFANFRASPTGMEAMCKSVDGGFAAPYADTQVPGCYTPPSGLEIATGSKTLTPKDDRYVQLLALLNLKPTTG